MRRVVYGEERGGGEVCDSKHYISGPSFSIFLTGLNQRWSLKEFRPEGIKAHCVSLSNPLYCIVEG